MKYVGHGSLKGGTNIFKAEWHDTIGKCTLRGSKGGLILVLGVNAYLVVTKETIHE